MLAETRNSRHTREMFKALQQNYDKVKIEGLHEDEDLKADFLRQAHNRQSISSIEDLQLGTGRIEGNYSGNL